MKGPLAGSCSRPSRRRRKNTLQRAHSAVFTNRYQAPATYPASLRLTAPPCGIAKSLCTKPPLDELHNARRHLVCGNSCGIDDDRVRGGAERRMAAGAIPPIALFFCPPHRLQVRTGASGPSLLESPAGPAIPPPPPD